jgi:hypothetical protein
MCNVAARSCASGQLAWSENAIIHFGRARRMPASRSTSASRPFASGLCLAGAEVRVLCCAAARPARRPGVDSFEVDPTGAQQPYGPSERMVDSAGTVRPLRAPTPLIACTLLLPLSGPRTARRPAQHAARRRTACVCVTGPFVARHRQPCLLRWGVSPPMGSSLLASAGCHPPATPAWHRPHRTPVVLATRLLLAGSAKSTRAGSRGGSDAAMQRCSDAAAATTAAATAAAAAVATAAAAVAAVAARAAVAAAAVAVAAPQRRHWRRARRCGDPHTLPAHFAGGSQSQPYGARGGSPPSRVLRGAGVAPREAPHAPAGCNAPTHPPF